MVLGRRFAPENRQNKNPRINDRGFREMTADWVYRLREQFPATSKTVFLDIAYENAGALFAREAVSRFFEDWGEVTPTVVKAGGEGKGRLVEVVAECRERVARLLGGVESSEIAFTKNTNEGLSAILQGFPFAPGDNVITASVEHPSVLLPCLNLERRGVDCIVVEPEGGTRVTPESLLRHANERTRFIVVSHVQSSSGYKCDLATLGAACRERGIYLLVDAIQSLGFTPFDAIGWGVDAVVSSTYKGLLGIEGVGILYCRQELLRQVDVVYAAANAFVRASADRSRIEIDADADARKFENSTLNFAGIYVLNEGLKWIESIGIEAMQAQIESLVARLYDGLAAQGVEIITPSDPAQRCHALSLLANDTHGLYEHCRQKGIFVSFSAGRYLRFSVGGFNTEEDIDAALATTREYLLRQGIHNV